MSEKSEVSSLQWPINELGVLKLKLVDLVLKRLDQMLNDPGPLAQNSATFLSGTCKASYDEIICRFTENSNRRSHSYDARIIRHMGLLRPGPKVTAGARRGSDKRVLWSSGSLLHPPFKPP